MVRWGYIKEGDTITMSDATKVTTLAKSGSSNAASIFIPTKISSFDDHIKLEFYGENGFSFVSGNGYYIKNRFISPCNA